MKHEENSIDIGTFLRPFFAAIKDADYLWFVAHGWEELPDYTRHDVDICLEDRGYGKLKRTIEDVAQQTGWRIFRMCRKSIYRPFLLLKVNERGAFKFIQLDLFLGEVLKGIPVRRTFREVLKLRWLNEKGIWCANFGYVGVCILLKEIVQNGCLGSESRERQVYESVSKDPVSFRQLLHKELCDELLVDNICECCTTKNWRKLESLRGDIQSRMPKLRLRNISKFIGWGFSSLKVRLCPFFRFFIVLVGPDGCGKTTIADAVEKYMDCNPFSQTYRLHSNFGFLPRLRDIYSKLARLFGKQVVFAAEPQPGTRHMGMQRPLSALRATFYVTYYAFDLMLSRIRIFRMYPYFTMILADRYYYDYYYMRGYMKCPSWYKRMLEWIIPKPDMILFLNRDAEKIYSQKPELSVDEIKRQQWQIQKYVSSRRGFYEINGNDGVDATVSAVVRAISERLEEISDK